MTNTHSVDLESGSNQYLSISDAAQSGLDISGDFTLEAWVKPESLNPSDTMFIISKDALGSPSTRSYHMGINRHWELEVYYGDDTYHTYGNTDEPVVGWSSVGQWTHFAATVDVSAKTIKYYVNGVEVDGTNTKSDASALSNSATEFRIGNAGDASGLYDFDGQIDDVRVWSDIRTASEIDDNKGAELSGSEANLEGYWTLNNSLSDETSNNNDLSNNGSADTDAVPVVRTSCTSSGCTLSFFD